MPTPTNTAGHGASERNCANCSAAGIVRMLTGKELTSGQVANGSPDDKPDADAIGGIDGQLRQIDVAIRKNTRRQGAWFGDASAEQDRDSTMQWMGGAPSGTAFVVYASGPIVSDGVAQVGGRRGGFRVQGALDLNANAMSAANIETRGGNRSHFLTAFKSGDQLRFWDYQTDTEGGVGVTLGAVPMLGIRTIRPRVNAGDPGTFTNATRFVVVAYPPNVWRGNGGPAIGQHRRR